MELQQYSQIFRQYWISALATLLACIGLAAAFTFLQTPKYTASASVFITVESGSSAGELSSGASYAERQVASFVSLADSALVLNPVVDELDLDMTTAELAEKVSVMAPANTSIIELKVEDEDPVRAAEMVNAVADSLSNATSEVVPQGPENTELVTATVIEPGVEADSPSSPDLLMNLALGALVGLLLGCGQAILRSALDTRIRTTDDVENISDAPVLASVVRNTASPEAKDQDGHARGVQWANAEAYRKLRTSIGFVGLGGERRSSMVITSSIQGEGKTETAINLSRVLAQAGERVLLIDADLRRPQVGPRLGLDSELGLSDVLTGRVDLEDVLIDADGDDLKVLAAGTVPPNPSELLGSEAMAHLLALTERQYDYVILDAPPLLPVTDSVVLGGQTGGAVVVARSGYPRKQQLSDALGILKTADVTVLGLVLNDVPASKSGGYSQYYY